MRKWIKASFIALSVVLTLAVVFFAVFFMFYNKLNHPKLTETDEELSSSLTKPTTLDDKQPVLNDNETTFYYSQVNHQIIADLQNTVAPDDTELKDDTTLNFLPMEEENDKSSDLIDQEIEELLRKSWIDVPEGEVVTDKNLFNILLLGTDYNVSESTDGRGRADATLLCSLNYKTGAVKLISFQRWITVPIPGHEAIELNRAYKYGGPEIIISLIEHLFLVKIDGYAQIDFDSFSTIIDLLGGVDIELTEKEALALNGKIESNAWTENEVFEGINHLNGQDALAYCRLRLIDDDWKRQERQRTTLSACKASLKELGPIEMVNVLKEALPLVNTNLSAKTVLKLLSHAGTFVKGSMETLQVPDRNSTDGVVSCDFVYETKKISNFLYGTEYELKSPYR